MPPKPRKQRKPPPPTPEETRAAAERKAEDDARHLAYRRQAARIIAAHGSPLFGVDMPHAVCAEEQEAQAHRDRLNALVLLLWFGGCSEEDCAALVKGEGLHGSDRMVAAWWAGVNVGWGEILNGAGTYDAPDGKAAQRLMAPLEDLIAARVVREEALDVIRGGSDPYRERRVRGRDDLSKILAEVSALAAPE